MRNQTGRNSHEVQEGPFDPQRRNLMMNRKCCRIAKALTRNAADQVSPSALACIRLLQEYGAVNHLIASSGFGNDFTFHPLLLHTVS
jgi:hypothetical protein